MEYRILINTLTLLITIITLDMILESSPISFSSNPTIDHIIACVFRLVKDNYKIKRSNRRNRIAFSQTLSTSQM